MSARLSMSLGTGADNAERAPKDSKGRKNREKNMLNSLREATTVAYEGFNLELSEEQYGSSLTFYTISICEICRLFF